MFTAGSGVKQPWTTSHVYLLDLEDDGMPAGPDEDMTIASVMYNEARGGRGRKYGQARGGWLLLISLL